MARGNLIIATRSPGFLGEAVKRVLAPALAMYPGSHESEYSEMGASAIYEIHSAQWSVFMDYQEQPAVHNESVANAIVKIAKKEADGHEAGCTDVLLWCTTSSNVNSRPTPALDYLGRLNATLTEADEDSCLPIERVRHAFGPLADSVVFHLSGGQLHMYYVEELDQPTVLLSVQTDDPNADSKIDEVLKTIETTWEQVIRADRRSKFQSWRRLKFGRAAFTEEEKIRSVRQLLRRLYVDHKSRPWVGHIARRASDLMSSLERKELPVEMACWLNEMNAKLVYCWCQEFFEKHPKAIIDFTKRTRRSQPFKGERCWDDPVVYDRDFLNHISAKLRDRASSEPDAPDVAAALRIQECNPDQIAVEDSTCDVIMCADVPVNPGEKWIKIIRDYWDAKTLIQLRTLVFPSRNFESAFNLFLADQDFRNLPGYVPMLEWQRRMPNLKALSRGLKSQATAGPSTALL